LAQIASTLNAGLMSWDAGLYYHPDWNLSGRNSFVFINSHSRLLFDINPEAVFAAYARLDIPTCFPQGTRICFSRELAERAVARTGRVFWAPYPDYSAPLLLLGLLENERYVYWDALMGYGGRSRSSNAAAWDKEGGKTGDPQRAREYFDELEQQDIYPHSDLKIQAYCNGHVETLNLLRKLVPEVFARYQVDPVALIAGVECELRAIGIHNPFLGPPERAAFDAYVKKQDPAVVEQAMEIVKTRRWGNSIETFRLNGVHVSWPVLRPLLYPRTFVWVTVMAIRLLDYKLTRPRPAYSQSTVSDAGPRLATKRIGPKTWLDCSSFGGKDGLDVVRKFNDIVAACDRRGPNNLADFFNKGFLLAAHEADEVAGIGDPIKVSKHAHP
jgi:hypothetical protein